MFSTVYADVGWLGRPKKVQKIADVIQGWSLRLTNVMFAK